MKKLLVIAFAISSLLRPSLVLCVESTGDIRVEYPEAFCCATEAIAPDFVAVNASAGECDGCLDYALSTQSLLKRASGAPQPAPLALVLPAIPAAQHSTVRVDRTLTGSPVTLCARILSSTVIRR